MNIALSRGAAVSVVLGAIFAAACAPAQANGPPAIPGVASTKTSTKTQGATMPSPSTDPFTKKKVNFKNSQIRMAGELYLPMDYEKLGKLPAIVVTHPAGAVKEQTPASYARGLAAKGFVVLTFDASHQGESGGEPRYIEIPADRVEDIRCAIDYLTTLPFVDPQRIGAMGVCAGGGYTIAAATTDRRIKAVAGVSATDAGAAMRDGWLGGNPVSEQLKLLEAASAQRTAEANGKPIAYGGYVPDAPDTTLPNTMQEAYVYYRTPRAQQPTSPNKVMFTSFNHLFAFSASDRIDTLLTQPLLLVAGTKADSIQYSRTFLDRAASKKKELVMVDGATHVDLYDREGPVGEAVAKLASFFKENL